VFGTVDVSRTFLSGRRLGCVVGRNPLRRNVAAVTGPAGVLLMAAALTAFLVPGFFS